MTEKRFLQGTIILSLAGFTSKVLGALYRIPLARILGGEGMGLYQMAYPIYTGILALSTAGVPVAISILVAEKLAQGDYGGAKKVFSVALTLLVTMGLFFALLVFSSAYVLAERVLQEPRAFYPIVAISPAVFFTAVVSAFRGYFQGHQEMVPTALSQVIEQLVRVITVLTGAWLLLPYGIEFGAAAATFGAVTGGAAALLVLLSLYVRFPRPASAGKVFSRESSVSLVRRIVQIALPLSVGGLVMPLMQMVDALIVPVRLQAAGLTASRATELFGQLTGMAGSLINLPSVIISSLTISLVPAVSEAVAQRQFFQAWARVSTCLRLTVLLCLPAAAGLSILAGPICQLLYDVAEAGVSLFYLAPGLVFLGLYQTTAGALQGLGRTAIPVFHLFLGLLLKSGLNYFLTAVPGVDIRGAALSSVMAFLLAFLLNYRALRRLAGLQMSFLEMVFSPLVATGIMVVAVKYSYETLLLTVSSGLATLSAVLLGILIYGISLLLLGGISAKDIVLIPGIGTKLVKILQKLHLLR